jgi:hypothetical protein
MRNEIFKDIAKDAVLEYTKIYGKDDLTLSELKMIEKSYSEFDLGKNESAFIDNKALHSTYVKDENNRRSVFVDVLIEEMRAAEINCLKPSKYLSLDDCLDIVEDMYDYKEELESQPFSFRDILLSNLSLIDKVIKYNVAKYIDENHTSTINKWFLNTVTKIVVNIPNIKNKYIRSLAIKLTSITLHIQAFLTDL